MSVTSTNGPPRPVTPVSILSHLLEDLVCRLNASGGAEANAGSRVDASFIAAMRKARDLAAGLDPYVAECTSPESAALSLLADRTAAADWSPTDRGTGPALEQEMLSGHVEGQTLAFLVHATRAVRVLEIGMFTGYSALAMAEALPDDGVVVACELDAAVAEFARECFAASPSGSKIQIRVGPALDTLAELAARGAIFDLVFIDADKPRYTAYLNALLESQLLAPHGIVCVDNTLMQGQPYLPRVATGDSDCDAAIHNGRAIAAFNRALADDPRVLQVLLPLRDGLTLVRRAPAADPAYS